MGQVTIDLITHNPKDDKFAMILVEEGPWPDEDIITKLRRFSKHIMNSEEIQNDLRTKAYVKSLSFEYSRGTLKEG